jgi:hypothetical protein
MNLYNSAAAPAYAFLINQSATFIHRNFIKK